MSRASATARRRRSHHARAQLLLDRGKVAPDVFTLDLVAVEFEDVQQAEAHGAALAFAAEQAAVFDAAVPDRLVDSETVAIQAAHGRDALALEVGEQRLVELPHAAAVVHDAEGRRHHVVFGAGREAAQDAFDVVRRFEHEMGVDQAIDFGWGQWHCRFPRGSLELDFSLFVRLVYHNDMPLPDQPAPRENQKARTRDALVGAATELLRKGGAPTVAEAAE